MKEIQPGVFKRNSDIYTVSEFNESVYGEKVIEKDGQIFRKWVPTRSKAAAAIENGLDLEVDQYSKMLYLGAASGTTVSHFSDILDKGFIFGVEYSKEVIRDLVSLSEARNNIAPILGDARKPDEYKDLISEEVDIVYQDISQKDQPEIFIKNVQEYLKEGGVGLFAVKAKSISTGVSTGKVFNDVKDKVDEELEIVEETKLEPFEKDHLFLKIYN